MRLLGLCAASPTIDAGDFSFTEVIDAMRFQFHSGTNLELLDDILAAAPVEAPCWSYVLLLTDGVDRNATPKSSFTARLNRTYPIIRRSTQHHRFRLTGPRTSIHD